jgi:D-alanyl-D-alanine dipeptidase
MKGSPVALSVLFALGVAVSSSAQGEPPFDGASDGPAYPVGSDTTLPGLTDVGALVPVKVELKYASTDNFMGRDVYGGLKRCFLVDDAAKMLAEALKVLKAGHPSWTFLMYDCARPRRVQLVMWDVVKGTKQQGYVANPHKPPGSIHNTGCAVDLSIYDEATQKPLDMGTGYDFFGSKAHPAKEVELWKKGELSNVQWANRLALREAMLRAGFRPLGHEWWHFDCAPSDVARKKYALIE